MTRVNVSDNVVNFGCKPYLYNTTQTWNILKLLGNFKLQIVSFGWEGFEGVDLPTKVLSD